MAVRFQRKMPRALTIAGSDSGGGAGIQADLKTFAAMKVWGMSAVTAVTAQNTLGLREVWPAPLNSVKAQIAAVVEDLGVDAAKTGMLYNGETVRLVADELNRNRLPLVIDPVIMAKDGSMLLTEEGVAALIEDLIPKATIITPNLDEAAVLSGLKVRSLDDARVAVERIVELGAESVLVKGGHLSGRERAADLLYTDGEFTVLEEDRIDTKNTHGTGCCLSAAITAGLARGEGVETAVRKGKTFVTSAIRFGLSIGGGYGPVDPVADLHNRAERYEVVMELLEAGGLMERSPTVASLVPECQMNLVMALPYATDVDEVAGVPGRIVRIDGGVRLSSCPRFGASRHVAGTLLVVMRYRPVVRAALNIKYSEEIIGRCRELGMTIAFYDRREEPDNIKEVEGMSTRWGAETAIEEAGEVPDVIYHLGDWGKEPMITLLGRTAMDVAESAVKISRLL